MTIVEVLKRCRETWKMDGPGKLRFDLFGHNDLGVHVFMKQGEDGKDVMLKEGSFDTIQMVFCIRDPMEKDSPRVEEVEALGAWLRSGCRVPFLLSAPPSAKRIAPC